MSIPRFAFIACDATELDSVRAYLPSNYSANAVIGGIGISGNDVSGWTLDGYVIPRLASGLRFAVEVKSLPAAIA